MDEKTILVPSGDQDGHESLAGWSVSLLTPEPSATITYISGLPSRLDVKTILAPSGDQDGSPLKCRVSSKSTTSGTIAAATARTTRTAVSQNSLLRRSVLNLSICRLPRKVR